MAKDEKSEAEVSGTSPDADIERDIFNFEDMSEEELIEAAQRAGELAAEEELAQEHEAKAAEQEHEALQELNNSLEEELKLAQEKADQAQDRLLRLQAEWENYRRRTAEERLQEKQRAAEGLVSNLLPVVDDLGRAVEHAQQAAEGNEVALQLTSGVEAVLQKLVGVLNKEGAELINPVDEPFEPLEHQAVGRVEDTEVFEETVRDVYQQGWRMGGKVIRPAMVTVTFGGPKRPVPDAEDVEGTPNTEVAEDAGDATDASGVPSEANN